MFAPSGAWRPTEKVAPVMVDPAEKDRERMRSILGDRYSEEVEETPSRRLPMDAYFRTPEAAEVLAEMYPPNRNAAQMIRCDRCDTLHVVETKVAEYRCLRCTKIHGPILSSFEEELEWVRICTEPEAPMQQPPTRIVPASFRPKSSGGTVSIEKGVTVRALDRQNFGRVIAVHRERGTALVWFWNKETGGEAEVELSLSMLVVERA